MQISIGPLYYFWRADDVMRLYAELAEQPVNRFYLGEVVCSKRRRLKLADWMSLGKDLQAIGHDVVLSTLTLIEAESEVSIVKRIVDNGEFLVECNDSAAIQFAVERELPFVAGPAINVYNPDTLAALVAQGLSRWVPPVELSGEQIREIFHGVPAGTRPELEILAQGRLPLAWSARCFSARYHDRAKDQCEFVCGEHPEGLAVRSLEEQGLFQINGIQTLSHQVCDLTTAWPAMRAMGASAIRISIDHPDQVLLPARWRALMDGDVGKRIPLADETGINGYWYGLAGMVRKPA